MIETTKLGGRSFRWLLLAVVVGVCLRGLRPNICANVRKRRQPKRGRQHLFSPEVYRLRFACERTFAWIDSFRTLLIRFDLKAAHFLGMHFAIYTLINLRSLLAE